MRRWAVCALELILVMVLAATAGAAEPDDDAPPPPVKSSGNWFTRLFNPSPKPAEKNPVEKKDKDEAAAQNQKALRAAAAAQRAREEAALLRRQGVCLKLRSIADQTNNEELRRQADQLDEQAWNMYLQRTAHLPGGESLDEATLERHLDQPSGRAAAPARDSRGADSTGRAALRGELP